jgi:polar amino acid transport system substrate-binding protein
MKRRDVFIACLVFVGLMLNGCASAPTTAPAAPVAPAATAIPTAAPTAAPTPVATISGDKLSQKGRLLICSDLPYPPMEFFDENGNPVGMDVDMGKEIGARLGLKVEFVNSMFDTIIAAVTSGKCDILISAMNITAERSKQISFIPYFQAGQSFVTLKGNPEKINGPMDLCGKSAAAESGTTEVDYLQGTGGYKDNGLTQQCVKAGKKPINVVITQKDSDAYQQLQASKVSVYSTDTPVAAYYVLQNSDQFQTAGPVMEPIPEGIGVPCGVSDCSKAPLSDVGKAVETALKSMQTDGTYAKILAQWKLSDGAVKP